MTTSLKFLFAVSCGLCAANLYYNQPLLQRLAHFFAKTPQQTSLVPMLTQVGYALGMFFIVPLGDSLPRKNLIGGLLLAVALALVVMAHTHSFVILLAASLAVGLTSSSVQILVPFAVQLTAPNERGKTLGLVMSGLLFGILLSRTVSGCVGDAFGWRVMFALGAFIMLLLFIVLMVCLPTVPPHHRMSYGALIRSTLHLVPEFAVLRRCAWNGALLFATFSAFWSTLDFLMHSSAYHQNSSVTGLFGLIGAAGALLAPWTGRWADKKNPQQLVGFATVLVVISFAILVLAHSIWFLIVGVVILDLGVQSALIANQTQIYGLKADAHSRMNTIFMTCYFTGGSLGSWVGGWAWNHFEWTGVCCVGLGFSSLALLSQKLSVFARAWSPLQRENT